MDAKKLVVDESFVVQMCLFFVEDYPIFDAEIFDPWRAIATDQEWSLTWL